MSPTYLTFTYDAIHMSVKREDDVDEFPDEPAFYYNITFDHTKARHELEFTISITYVRNTKKSKEKNFCGFSSWCLWHDPSCLFCLICFVRLPSAMTIPVT